MKKLSLAISLVCMLPSHHLYAKYDSHLVYNSQNTAVFEVRFFDVDDGPFASDPQKSTWNLDQQHKAKILAGIRYWANIIQPKPEKLPAIINVGTYDENNAEAGSDLVKDGSISLTQLQAALNGKDPGKLEFGAHGQVIIGKFGELDRDHSTYIPSQLPPTNKADLVSTSTHELAHALGILSMVSDRNGEKAPVFDSNRPFNSWTKHLHDDNRNPAKPGQVILCKGCNNTNDPQGFDLRRDKGYFTSQHVNEVLAGAMSGIPIKILGDYGSIDDNYMSHIELKNSLMSHQNYRNYTGFMEAELAVMQDMGYQIDRRNFFGFSVYDNGQTLINRHGYFLRNAQGNAYVPGKYNMAERGLGLHVYGSNNRIFQKADLLTLGAGAAGIRVDGQNNTLSIEPETRIYADGYNGRGVMFTYGKGHNLIQRGDIQALGNNGVAISFDFGNNSLGNKEEYRGSYIHVIKEKEKSTKLLPELNGALVDNVDISGRVAGKTAAIYMSKNALVSNINILNGAQLEGNIDSKYDQKDAYGRQRLTQLSFGRLADSQGRATDQADPHFMLHYKGNIKGINNLDLNALGGVTSLNGNHQIYSMYIAPKATLSGNSDYTLNQEGRFVNNGIIAPDNPNNPLGKITVAGNYQQRKNGQLQLKVDGRGGHDTFIVNGHAELNGQLTFVPQRDWYAANWQLDSSGLLKTKSRSGEFSKVNSQLHSPTLRLQTTPQRNGAWQLTMLRARNAYSQYAQDNNANQVGKALDSIVSTAQPDIQQLYRVLDFSAADGSAISNTLDQLSPAGYSAMFANSLNREQQIANIISGRHTVIAPMQLVKNEWQSFAVPFVSNLSQKHQGNSVGYNASSYGVVFGAEKQSESYRNWIFGLHGAISGQSATIKLPESGTGKMTAFNLGIQARYAVNPLAGAYMFGNGRFGIEDGRMDRNIHVNDYTASNHASWKGLSGSFMAGGGYRWALSEKLSAGPTASLNYTTLSRRGMTETGSDGSRLKLDSNTFNSLRSSIGVNSNWSLPLSSGAVVTTDLQLAWNHELLNTDLVQNASFANYRNVGFSSKNQVAGRDSLGLKAGMRYQINKNIELGAGVTSEVYRSGHNSVSGNLSTTWRF
ncbi:autotransporter outer membrane beta-barrel domain-containing protein [Xenorhabdus anantnagensis]|uniref:Autotransporter outer membrane beta-barrel domain-containing protein n=1 Tax=Xenorhabdus anantnagensis TaxID=3025875 RepID=A0ABT5LWA8_9GAMM|nr:autotransporter outer membrane beta-barrel domain-containing protein [Xenorhabdus anantnagensis]MDC9598023.1 autotransporter outer membrane beta-barrel domain-containing protein [Xenorhabdus anantnagensis]